MAERQRILEGFPLMTNGEFIAMFCEHNRCGPEDEVTRIEFEYVDPVVVGH